MTAPALTQGWDYPQAVSHTRKYTACSAESYYATQGSGCEKQ